MTPTLIYFRVRDGEYAIPVEHVREVRSADAVVPLPGARADVAGLLRAGAEALTVLAPLGDGGNHVLLVGTRDRTFGLLVGEVTQVAAAPAEIGPPPHGQDDDLVAGVITRADGLVLLVDVDVLEQRLEHGA
ncbi:MAG: chemotaxis protein CheW [Actinobacteria bacterium]|nr:chemotaxis protein CheW [Actinomycetota bacterium]